jgi:hypothetical protein
MPITFLSHLWTMSRQIYHLFIIFLSFSLSSTISSLFLSLFVYVSVSFLLFLIHQDWIGSDQHFILYFSSFYFFFSKVGIRKKKIGEREKNRKNESFFQWWVGDYYWERQRCIAWFTFHSYPKHHLLLLQMMIAVPKVSQILQHLLFCCLGFFFSSRWFKCYFMRFVSHIDKRYMIWALYKLWTSFFSQSVFWEWVRPMNFYMVLKQFS